MCVSLATLCHAIIFCQIFPFHPCVTPLDHRYELPWATQADLARRTPSKQGTKIQDLKAR